MESIGMIWTRYCDVEKHETCWNFASAKEECHTKKQREVKRRVQLSSFVIDQGLLDVPSEVQFGTNELCPSGAFC